LEVAVKDIWVEVGPVGPGDCPALGVYPNLRKGVVVPRDFLKYRTPEERSQIYHTLRPVGEREPDYSILQDFDFCYIHHDLLLTQGFNGTGRLVIDGSIPTFRQLVPVEGSPLKHHSGGAPGELTVEKAAIESDSGAVLAIAGVKVRRIVITEEHQDGDPIERADAWHGFRTYCPGPTGLTRIGRQQLSLSVTTDSVKNQLNLVRSGVHEST
jgi:hypothetical protein